MRFLKLSLLAGFLGCLIAPFSIAFAASQSGITYHGRILKPDGTPLENTNVKFRLQIRSPGTENCLLYEEQQTKNLAGSGGVFSITLNDGSGSRGVEDEYASGQRLSLERVFQNKAGFPSTLPNCDFGATYSPNSADGRRFQVFFRDLTMAAWEPLPAATINYVPFALEAKSISGFTPQNLLRVEDASGIPAAAPAFSPAQMNELVNLITGVSALYTRAGQLGGAALPTLSAGQSLQWNGTTWTAATPLTSESDPTVQAFAKAALPNCGSGEVLKSNGTSFSCVADIASGTPTDATTSAKGVVQISAAGGISVSAGVISLPDQASITAGNSYPKVTVDAKGRVTAGAALAETDLPSITSAWSGSIDGGKIVGAIGGSTAISTSGPITTGGAVGGRAFNLFDVDTNKISFVAPALSADYTLTWPAALPGSNGQILSVNTSGQLSWVAPSSGSVTSVTATAPLASTGGATPQISITQANGTTNGYLSSTDWSTFNNKLGTTLTDGNIWVGNSSNAATGVVPSGDVTMTNAGAFTVTRIRGRDVATTAPVTGQVLRYNASNAWESANFSVNDLKKADGTSQFASATCAAGQTLNWSSLTDTFTCTNISIASTQVSGLGTAAAKNFGTAAGNLVELDAGAKIPASLLPTGAASQWTTSGSDIYYSTGNVGIGLNNFAYGRLGVANDIGIAAFNTVPSIQLVRTGSAVASNTGVGEIKFRPTDGTNAILTAVIGAGVTSGATVAANSIPTDLHFSTGTTAPTERMRILSNGNVGIGTTNPAGMLELSSTGANASLIQSVTGSGTPYLTQRLTGAGSTIVSNGAYLGEWNAAGYDGASFRIASTIRTEVDGAPASGSMPGRILFLTTPTGSITPVERMRISQSGHVAIGTTTTTLPFSVATAATSGVAAFSSSAGFADVSIQSPLGFSAGFTMRRPSTGGTRWRLLADGATESGSNSGSNFKIESFDDTGALLGTPLYIARSTSNVGIGTMSPGAPLDVKGEIRLSGATSGYTGFRPAAAAGSTVWQLPATDGSSGQALVTNGSGVLTWQTPSGTGVSTLTVNAPITNSGTATAPNLSIAQANGSTNGYLSSTDWTTFNSKLGTGLTSANIWVGNGSNVATAVAPSGDVSLTNAGAFTVTRLQSRTVASTLPVTSQVLRYNTATTSWEPQYINFADLKKADGSSQFPGTACTASQTLSWSSLTDTFVCSNISITSAQVSGLGTAAAKNFGTAAGNLVELDAGGKVPSALLPAGSSQWTTSGSNISYTAGNVGVGTASPARSLHVSGGLRLEPAALPSSPAAGDLAVDSGDANQFKYHDGSAWRTLSTFAQYNWDNRVYTPAAAGFDGQPEVATNAMYNTNALDGAAAVLRIGVRNTAGNYQNAYIGSVSNSAGFTPNIVFGQRTSSTNFAERMRIDGSGNIGIGTASPGYPLEVAYSSSSIGLKVSNSRDNNTAYAGLMLERTRSSATQPTAGFGTGVDFYLEGTADGTTVQTGSLYSAWEVDPTNGANRDSYLAFSTLLDGAPTASERMRITSSGNVGIGTTNPGAALDVKGAIRMSGATSGYTGFQPAAAAGSTVWTLPTADGSTGQVLTTNGSGVLTWSTPSGTGVSSVTATAPLSSTGGATPQISMTQANGSTNGYLSSTDWTTFNSKLGTSLTNGAIWVGNGSSVATAVAPAGDVTMTNAGVFSVTKLRGYAVQNQAPGDGQVMVWSGGGNEWRPQNFGVSHLRGATGLAQFASATCSASQTLTWSSLTDTLTCNNIAIANSQVSGLGTASTKNFGTAAGNLVELDAGAKIPASLLPSGTTSQWTTNGTRIYYNGGNVGIGTAAPDYPLHVSKSGYTQVLVEAINDSVEVDFAAYGTGSQSMLFLSAARGTEASPTYLQAADRIGYIGASPSQSGAQAARIEFTAAANWTGATTPGIMSFATTPVNATVPVERMRIDEKGNIGIGTLTPTAVLNIDTDLTVTAGTAPQVFSYAEINPATASSATYLGNSANAYVISGAANITGSVNAANGYIEHQAGSTLSNAKSLYGGVNNTSTGTITNAYAADLAVSNSGTGTISNAHGIRTGVSRASGTITNAYGVYVSTVEGTNKWSFYASDANAPSYYAGRVGIGVVSPSAALDVRGGDLFVQGSGNQLKIRTTGGSDRVALSNNGGSYGSVALFNSSDAKNVELLATGNSYFNAGNVGFGNTAPEAKVEIHRATAPTTLSIANEYLHIGGAEQTTNGYRVIGFGYNTTEVNSPAYFGFLETDAANSGKGALVFGTRDVTTDTYGSERMRIASNGNVGIGTATINEKLVVNGNVLATSFLYSSDRRLKTDIRPVEDSLEKLTRLSGVTFEWKKPLSEEAKRTQLGVIAQEVEAQFPQAVVTDREGVKRVNYPSLIAPVIEAIKELYAKWTDQEVKVQAMKGEVIALQGDVKRLEAENKELQQRLQKIEEMLSRKPASKE